MEGRPLPPRPSIEVRRAPRASLTTNWPDPHALLGLARRVELNDALQRASALAAEADAAEPSNPPKETAASTSFSRALYELEYASRDLQASFQQSAQADIRKGNLRHCLKFKHLAQHADDFDHAFQFLTSIEGAGWAAQTHKATPRPIPVTRRLSSPDGAWGSGSPLGGRRQRKQSAPADSPGRKSLSSKQKKMIKNLRPLEAVLNDLKLQNKEWFHGVVDRKDAEEQLSSMLPGGYLFRISTSHKGLTLSLNTTKGCKHYLIHYQEGAGYYIFGKSKAFKHINDLVRYYNANPISGINQMLIFPAEKKEEERIQDDDTFGGQNDNYTTLLAGQLDQEVLAVVEELARERRDAEHAAAQRDPMGFDGDVDPVLAHQQATNSPTGTETRRRKSSWFRRALSSPSESFSEVGPPVPLRSSLKSTGRKDSPQRWSLASSVSNRSERSEKSGEESFGFAPVLTSEELRARIAELDAQIEKEGRMAKAAANLHHQPGSSEIQSQRRAEVEISMARLASLQASRREYQEMLDSR
eukprot:TRINITY_DN10931_c0_g1_i1.p2 TRINITY_DN10931_c0_g1~~TRINITY_DN10931_c0_g1_i1.p2  ORF type:complete len:528 (+),score=81.21 TRINITY_DN10931_c0_g1_i1:74-1657(+)